MLAKGGTGEYFYIMTERGEIYRYFPDVADFADSQAEDLEMRPLQLRLGFWILSREVGNPFFISHAVYGIQRPANEVRPELEIFRKEELLNKPNPELEEYYARTASPGWDIFLNVRWTFDQQLKIPKH